MAVATVVWLPKQARLSVRCWPTKRAAPFCTSHGLRTNEYVFRPLETQGWQGCQERNVLRAEGRHRGYTILSLHLCFPDLR